MNRLELSLVLVFTAVLLLPAATALQCVIGVSVQVGNSLIPIGGMVAPCSGECSNTTIYGTIVIYACDPIALCKQFSLSNSCDNEAQNISGCCCDTGDNCNFPGVPPTLAPGVTLPPPIQCFAGIGTAGSTLGIGASVDCVGDCANFTIDNTTVYFLCTPISVCENLNIDNRCQTIENLGGLNNVDACCCSTPNCNFPIQFGSTIPTITAPVTTASDQCPSNNQYQNIGELASPGYPAVYANNLNCYYHLIVPIRHHVIIQFRHFYTEACCDVVTLYDGDSIQSKVIARLSGQLSTPTPEYATSFGNNQMLITFITDGSTVNRGWMAVFYSDEDV